MSDAVTMTRKFTIGAGNTESDAQNVQGFTLVAISIPSSWTTANLTFKGDIEGAGSYQIITDTAGTSVVWVVGSADVIICPIGADALIGGLVNLKIVSSASQVAQRIITGHFIKTQR